MVISQVLQYMYPNAIIGTMNDAVKDIVIGDDGMGAKVLFWNTAKLGAQPTLVAVQAAAAAAQQAQLNQAAAIQGATSRFKNYAASTPATQQAAGISAAQDQFNRDVILALQQLWQQAN